MAISLIDSLVEIIAKKRDGGELEDREIERLVSAFTSGELADYQMSAWLMEVKALTRRSISLSSSSPPSRFFAMISTRESTREMAMRAKTYHYPLWLRVEFRG